MNIIDYVKKFGNESFKETPLRDADVLVFAALSYMHFDIVAPDYSKKDECFYLREMTDEQIPLIGPLTSKGKREKEELLYAVKNSVRFKDVGIKYVMNVFDDEFLEQFFALTFVIPEKGLFIVYRGTDSSLVGWKENCVTMWQGASAAQIDSVEYLRLVFSHIGNEKVMVGGHSKGGNLAYYAMIYSPAEFNERITKAYSLDGPGFFTKDYRSRPNYEKSLDRMVQIVPRDSIVGEIFYTPNNHTVINARGKGMAQHHIYCWEITDSGELDYIEKRSFYTRIWHRTTKTWSRHRKKEDRALFVDGLLKAFTDENGEFQIMTGSKAKLVIKTARENYPFRTRIRFYFTVISLGLEFIGNTFYYIFKPSGSKAKKNDVSDMSEAEK